MDHKTSVCNKEDCIYRKEWTPEMPYVLSGGKWFEETATIRICSTCIHFLGFDSYISVEELNCIMKEES